MAKKKKKKSSSKKKGGAQRKPERGRTPRPKKESPPDSPEKQVKWPDYITYAVIAFLLFCSILFIVRSTYVVLYPYTINYSEDSLLVSALELANGRNPYAPYQYQEIPYVLTPYPPLFYSIVAALSKITGPSLQPGRLVSAFSSLGIAIFIFLIIKRESQDRLAAISGGIAYLTLYPVYLWGALHRVDNLTLLLAVSGLFFGTARKASRPQLIASMLLLLGSILTKQSSGAAFAVVLVSLWGEDRKRALWFAGGFLVLWGIFFTIFNIFSDWGYYYCTVTSLSTNPISWDRFEKLTGMVFKNPLNSFLLVLIIVALTAGWVKLERWAVYVGITLFQGLSTVGKFGSGTNYFLELDAGMAIMMGLIVWKLRSSSKRDEGWAWIPVSLILIFIMVISFQKKERFIKTQWYKVTHISKIKSDFRADDMVEKVSKNGDIILTKWVDLSVLVDRVPVMNDPFTFGFLAEIGKWDESKVLDMVRNESFPVVIADQSDKTLLGSEFFSESLKKEIKTHYTYIKPLNGIHFYLPNRVANRIKRRPKD